MKISDQTLQKIIDTLNTEKQSYQVEIDRINQAIQEITSLNNGGELKQMAQTSKIKDKPKKAKKKTMVEILTKLFSDNIPRTSRELMNHYNSVKKTNIQLTSFSSQFSPLVNKRKVFKKQTFPENPNETMTYYGLPEWFEGETLKQNFLDNIKKP